ncbi:MAG: FAD-dependent oxidoreductase [Cyanobacteria bacterium J06632_3]
MRLYSAAIIGASPAGCAAAITLANKGLDVLLIDVSEFSEDLPLEGLSPEERLRHRHRADVSSPHSMEWREGQTWRSRGNQSLMAVAQAQGVEIWKDCRVDAAILEAGQLMGLTTERGTVRAYHILDASGQRQWLSQQLDIPTKLSSPQLMAQVKPATWQIRDRFAGPGWFLLGKAAANPAPAASYGWLRTLTYGLQAVMSGLHAAREIADCEHGKISETLAAQRYSQWLQTWFIGNSAASVRMHPHVRTPLSLRKLTVSALTNVVS